MNYYLKNLDILSKKFPLLYLQLLSKKDINKKKVIYKNEDIDFSKINNKLVIYKCNFKNHFSLIYDWLKLNKNNLHIIDDDLDNLALFFKTKEAFFLLKNKRVYFYFFTDITKVAKQITKNSISKEISVISFVENKKFESLKKEISQLNLLSSFNNEDSLFSFKIFKNFYLNFEKLKSSFLLNKLKNKFKNCPVIVVGAGPSLKYSYEKLKKLQNSAIIIAGGSAITCLTKEGISPHLGVIVDPNLEEFKRMRDSLAFEIPIIYSTRVNNGVFSTFNGSTGYIKAAIGGFFEIWLDEELKIKDKYIFHKSDERSLTVISICMKIAKILGCNPIIIDGVDLAYTEDKLYPSDIIENNNPKDNFIQLLDKMNNSVKSTLSWEIEKNWLENFAKLNKSKIFLNATKNGLKIETIPDMSLDEIENKYLKKEIDFKAYIHAFISQSYLKDEYDFSKINDLKNKLRTSFLNTKNYLIDIIKNKPEYKAILAKENIKDEIAYKYFLLTLDTSLRDCFNDSKNNHYKNLKKSLDFFIKKIKSAK